MTGIWAPHAQAFLFALMVVTTAAFALPIFLAPLAWARRSAGASRNTRTWPSISAVVSAHSS